MLFILIETSQMTPLEISKEDWRKTQEKYEKIRLMAL
jgi:hypothetical protein